jgi:hypothetical protein
VAHEAKVGPRFAAVWRLASAWLNQLWYESNPIPHIFAYSNAVGNLVIFICSETFYSPSYDA